MWTKTPKELCLALSAPFSSEDIEWRVSATNRDKTKGLAVPYVTNRAIQNRLDHTVGIDGWHNDFVPWKGDRAQLCGISIYFPAEHAVQAAFPVHGLAPQCRIARRPGQKPRPGQGGKQAVGHQGVHPHPEKISAPGKAQGLHRPCQPAPRICRRRKQHR